MSCSSLDLVWELHRGDAAHAIAAICSLLLPRIRGDFHPTFPILAVSLEHLITKFLLEREASPIVVIKNMGLRSEVLIYADWAIVKIYSFESNVITSPVQKDI